MGDRSRGSTGGASTARKRRRRRPFRRAETLPEDQMLLALEDVEQTEAGEAAETEAKSAAEHEKATRKLRTNRGALPPHLPRIETVVDIEDKACPCCKGTGAFPRHSARLGRPQLAGNDRVREVW